MGVHREDKMGICHHLEIGTNSQIFLKKLKPAAYSRNSCNDSFVFRHDTHTGQNRVHCCGVMQFWACSSLMSAILPAEGGYETWVRIVLKLAFIA